MYAVMGSLVGGLGLFFAGLKLLTEHLKMVGGRKLRQRIANWTRNPLLGVIWGGFFITITQSTAAATFILIGMLRSGMMTVGQALPIVVGYNLQAGLGLLILLFDIKIGVLFLLGVAGFAFSSGRAKGLATLGGVLLGLGMLFLGLFTMQAGVAPLVSAPWFEGFLQDSRGSYLSGFLIAAVLSVLVQSSIAVTVVAIALERTGLCSLAEAMMIVYGANAGSSLLTLMLSWNLSGHSKQIAMFQTGYNFLGVIVLVPAFYLEVHGGISLIKALTEGITQAGGTQIAIVYILFNVISGLIALTLLRPSIAFLEYFWPETIEERVSRPKYIHQHATDDPDTALKLIELEQTRLIALLSNCMNAIREGVGRKQLPAYQEAFKTLGRSIGDAMSDLTSGRQLSAGAYHRLNLLFNLQHELNTANHEVGALGDELQTLKLTSYGYRFSRAAVEGIDIIALTLLDVATKGSAEDADFLFAMTADDGKGLAAVRSAYLSEESQLDSTARIKLLSACNHCERLIWLFGEMGRRYMSLWGLRVRRPISGGLAGALAEVR